MQNRSCSLWEQLLKLRGEEQQDNSNWRCSDREDAYDRHHGEQDNRASYPPRRAQRRHSNAYPEIRSSPRRRYRQTANAAHADLMEWALSLLDAQTLDEV